MENTWDQKQVVSIFLLWLFHLSALVGIQLGHGDWFLPLTPLNLLLCFVLLVWNIPDFTGRELLVLAWPFALGMLAEILGVNFGWIFGNYAYGDNLGPKIWGVPWMIGLNWALLTYASSSVAKFFSQNLWVSVVLGAGLMLGIDVLLEQVAPPFDFWEFEGGMAPAQNYWGWFVVALLAHVGFQKFCKKANFVFSLHLLLVFALFFGAFVLFGIPE
jgi:bisanhydrobacterioruberin hydratase